MAFISLSLLAFSLTAQANVVTLNRVYTPNEKLAYQVKAHMTAEQRMAELKTFLPEDIDISYSFSTQVMGQKADGIAVLRYIRPTVTETIDASGGDGPVTKTEKINDKLDLTMSPINEVIELKNLNPPKEDKKKPKSDDSIRMRARGDYQPAAQSIFGTFIGEVQRLALFVGSMDSSLDFAPKLPLQKVKVGDTWKKTVGYSPQKLKGKNGKQAVQRLDYTYTYLGPMTVEGKQILRVQAKLLLNTDLAEFAKQLVEGNELDSLGKFPLKLDATINFDLDPKTKTTLHAEAVSKGGFELYIAEREEAMVEEKFKGNTSLTLVGSKIIPPTKKG